MGTDLHDGACEETENASDLRIENRKYERPKQRSRSQEAFARIPDTKKECALSPFQYGKLRGPQTGRDTRGGPKKGRFGGDVCRIAQGIFIACVLHSAE